MIPITIRPGATTAAVRRDRVWERLAHHPAASGDDHEEEGAVELREEPSPLLVGVLEVAHRAGDVLVDPAEDVRLGLSHLLAHALYSSLQARLL